MHGKIMHVTVHDSGEKAPYMRVGAYFVHGRSL